MTELAPENTQPLFILMHGWGFDAHVWDGVRAALPVNDHLVLDRGYFGAVPGLAVGLDEIPAGFVTAGRPLVAVGHSLGVMELLGRADVAWAGIVAISGFPRFSWHETYPEGVRRRVIERMIQRFDEDPLAVLTEFRARCGVTDPPPPVHLDRDRLRAGLGALLDGDARGAAVGLSIPKLVLATADDPIVSPSMARAAAAGLGPQTPLVWRAEGGHMTPLTAPEWCADHILTFADRLTGDVP